MSDYTAVGNAIKTTFLADSWLGNAANVKTIETEKRGYNLQDKKDANYFSENDLPALAIIPNGSAKTSEQTTTNEIENFIKPEIVCIVRGRDLRALRAIAQTITGNVERVLEKQKTSSQALGIDAFVLNVTTTDEEIKDGEYYFIISTTNCDVEITTTF